MLVIPLFVFFRSLHFTDNYISVILADSALTLPFSILILRTGFLQVPRDLEEAALIDGTTRLGALRRVIVPMVRPNLVAVTLLAFLVGWGDFVFSLSFLQNQELHPLALGVYNFIGYYRSAGKASWPFHHHRVAGCYYHSCSATLLCDRPDRWLSEVERRVMRAHRNLSYLRRSASEASRLKGYSS